MGLKPLLPLDSDPPLGSLHSRSRPPAFSRYCPFCFKCSALTSSPHFCRGSTPTSHSDPISSYYAPPTYRFLLGPSPSLPGPAPPPPIILRPHTSLQVPPLSEHQWGAGLMAARECLVGGLSWGPLLPLPWKQPGAARATERRRWKERRGLSQAARGTSGSPRPRGPPASPHTRVHLLAYPGSASLPPPLYTPARRRDSDPLKTNFATSSGNPTVRHFREWAGSQGDGIPVPLGLA